MHSKRFFAATILITILMTIGPIARALTFEDINLLITLGLLTEEQATIAREAITTGSVTGNAGTSVRSDEFAFKSCLVFTSDLVRGMSGSAVGALQIFLRQNGFYDYPEITNYYGPTTAEAVIDFQLAQRLVFSRASVGAGNVGPRTREKIKEISCLAALTPPPPTPSTIPEETPSIITPLPPEPTLIVQPPQIITYRVSILANLISENRETGEHRYQFDFDIQPRERERKTHMWKISLACDPEFVKTNRKDLTCNTSTKLFSTTKEAKSIKLTLTNIDPYRHLQPFTITAEAIDSSERVIDSESFSDDLLPIIASVNQNQLETGQLIGGAASLPSTALCSAAEQLRFLRYIMTPPTAPLGQIILPPGCYPGDVACSNDYPISYCFIRGTSITSDDLCPKEDEIFYNGVCNKVEQQ